MNESCGKTVQAMCMKCGRHYETTETFSMTATGCVVSFRVPKACPACGHPTDDDMQKAVWGIVARFYHDKRKMAFRADPRRTFLAS